MERSGIKWKAGLQHKELLAFIYRRKLITKKMRKALEPNAKRKK
jgi:hypothetical protein